MELPGYESCFGCEDETHKKIFFFTVHVLQHCLYIIAALPSSSFRDFFTASLFLSFEVKGEPFASCQHLFPLIYRIESIFSVILSSISLAIIKLYKVRLLGQFFQIYILNPKSSRVLRHPHDIIACTTDHFYPSFFTLTLTGYRETMAKFPLITVRITTSSQLPTCWICVERF